MKFPIAIATLLALTNRAAAAVDSSEVAFVTVFYNDLKGNLNEYLSYIQAHTENDNAPLLSLYAQVQTYTDDSYTTVIDDNIYKEISTFATALPWYSTRLVSEYEDAVGGGSTEAASSTEASSSAKSSSAPVTSSSSAKSSSAATTKASSKATSKASSSASSIAPVATSENSAPAFAPERAAVMVPLLVTLGLLGVSTGLGLVM
ncbi:unnamed protein product [Kuraishia capsulata CBS 1993]|uniref:Temperature shock-inducible protein 1 n=1 Tax=Kuraishia capsulata CBS 1993 TaxID=1382522 RepID=W6MGG6_9ASCO|nr:uncharacterized protein KUCA_T00000564001 [Kuraishia capsulata CBS 1993]CDK24598.1 unnamed protein product [Kuraishia capsulata CBS 1993]